MMNGKIVQVSGSVVDVVFEKGKLPKIKEALAVELEHKKRVMEVAQHIGGSVVRCIMLSESEGLYRGMEVVADGHNIRVPVGEATLGRMFNVLGEPIDGGEPIGGQTERWDIHREAPRFDEQSPAVEILETGIKVIDLLEPYPKGGKNRFVRRRGRGKNRTHPGAHTQCCHGARRILHFYGRRRALPRGERSMEGNARKRRYG